MDLVEEVTCNEFINPHWLFMCSHCPGSYARPAITFSTVVDKVFINMIGNPDKAHDEEQKA